MDGGRSWRGSMGGTSLLRTVTISFGIANGVLMTRISTHGMGLWETGWLDAFDIR